ncbi:folylpolyglutamate synthase/dihydrofolate synthase family protein [Telluribacter sp. SYSU D00476]|uniref:bifunctional folylpolyglutamate synthase/dihydrofolate synthase n=1 Tax=Telluribacter sp. SYSU D00476 TaxID=2811430 RepID=UPI001FF41814|nr:folylpolyglutamate synthase/dihydrofolate synthase family protein [Telluribacter sp. SYSU D00476]
MTYNEAIEYLYSRLPIFQNQGARAYKPGLHTTYQFCERLGNPQQKFRSVHVAGTNGKGSTSHMLASVLQTAGYHTGLYTSPHLKSFTERIRIDGTPVDEGYIVQFVTDHQEFIETVKPSFFEVTVAMAFDYFAKMEVDVAVVEVGMGGRLDSTNVIIPELSVITNISYDHMQYLGNTLPEIAREKAGIIKYGVPVVISERQDEVVAQVFQEVAGQQEAPITFASDLLDVLDSQYFDGKLLVQIQDKQTGTSKYKDLALELAGIYQLKNIKGVVAALEILREKGWAIPDEALRGGLATTASLTGLKGRWQKLSDAPLILCDTAHNAAGISSVLEQLSSLPARSRRFVLGFVSDKDVSSVLKLFPKDAFYYFCAPSNMRALDASKLLALAGSEGLEGKAFQDVNIALSEAVKEADPDDVIYVGGSTFVVADLNTI